MPALATWQSADKASHAICALMSNPSPMPFCGAIAAGEIIRRLGSQASVQAPSVGTQGRVGPEALTLGFRDQQGTGCSCAAREFSLINTRS